MLIIKAYKSNSKFSNNSKLIALDENGKQFSSVNFSKIIADYQLNGCSELNFVIGGAFGLAKEVLELLKNDSERTYNNYETMLNERFDGSTIDENKKGLARELARMNLTLNTYTE